jgi:radical SAM superfamily enzyme YgiQ (UPF0313 family)
MRAANDLAYAAAVLRTCGFAPVIRDWQTEGVSLPEAVRQAREVAPALTMISVTNASIYADLEFARTLQQAIGGIIVLKGAVFFKPPTALYEEIDLRVADYLIGGELEFSIGKIARLALQGEGSVEDIPAISWRAPDGSFIPTRFDCWETDLDQLPFPARDLLNNDLYLRPDTGRPLATIQTSRGCPSGCSYCLTPLISGKVLRQRSPENVMAEIRQCAVRYHIFDFFFRADTFTMDGAWVRELCQLIRASELSGKIAFSVNSRTKPLEFETLRLLKEAGCFMLALGYESGSNETLKRIHKGTTTDDNRRVAAWAQQLNLPVYGFFMAGFPWEGPEYLAATRSHLFELAPEFCELHIALPYWGTELWQQCNEAGLLKQQPLGQDYFESSLTGTSTLSIQALRTWRKATLRAYYLRPVYLWQRLREALHSDRLLRNYLHYGWRFVRNLFGDD